MKYSKTLWIQSNYEDLEYIFETYLNLYFTPEFYDFVYDHSDTTINLDYPLKCDYEFQESEQENDFSFLEDVNICKNRREIYCNLYKTITNELQYTPIFKNCSFDIFYDWMLSLDPSGKVN